MNFKWLCDQLGIDSTKPDLENLALLKPWFQEHVSLDTLFEGELHEQFKLYEDLIDIYFNKFFPYIAPENKKNDSRLTNDDMFEAVSLGFDRVLLALKPDKALLNTVNLHGMSLLHIAAVKGYVNTVQVLLALGADAAILNNQSQYPLFSALMLPILHHDKLMQNKLKIFNLLRERSSLQHLMHQDNSGDTILHQMASQGFATLLHNSLQTNVALASIKNNHTHYPIHTAILNNQIQCVNYLLAVKGTANFTDSQGLTPLHYAARFGNKEILQQCCLCSENIDVIDQSGRTPLMLAAAAGHLAAVKILIEQKAHVELTDLQGFTVLHHAVQGGNLELVRWLVENTAVDIKAQDIFKQTPLHISEFSGATAIRNFLQQSSGHPRA